MRLLPPLYSAASEAVANEAVATYAQSQRRVNWQVRGRKRSVLWSLYTVEAERSSLLKFPAAAAAGGTTARSQS
jgi:hypothetical protein